MNVYVDGSLAEQAPQTEAILNTQNPMNVAMCGCHEYAGAGFDGRMSEVSKSVGGTSRDGRTYVRYWAVVQRIRNLRYVNNCETSFDVLVNDIG